MPAADLLHESYRRLAAALPAAAGRVFDRLADESAELAPLVTAARRCGAETELVQAVAVLARYASAAEPLGRFLDGLAARAEGWGVTADDAAAAREILLDVLAEAAGGDWDRDVESAWAEVLETAEARLRERTQAAASLRPHKVGGGGRRIPVSGLLAPDACVPTPGFLVPRPGGE